MELSKIAQFVADCYGVPVQWLEAGAFPKDEAKVLHKMFLAAQDTHDKDLWREYLEQKAKFILDPKKGIPVHDGDTFKYIPR
jgi:hypothetical protein